MGAKHNKMNTLQKLHVDRKVSSSVKILLKGLCKKHFTSDVEPTSALRTWKLVLNVKNMKKVIDRFNPYANQDTHVIS